MKVMKWSLISLAVAGASSPAVNASEQSDAKGFVEDSSLSLNLRNYYFNMDRRNGAGDSSTEWAQGFYTKYTSGFTQGLVGVGVDAFGFEGIKLDGGQGKNGSGLLPTGDDGKGNDDYSQAGGDIKIRFSNTTLKYGQLRTTAPVFSTADARLKPESATGFDLMSNEIPDLTLEAGHFTAFNLRSETNSDEDLPLVYGGSALGGGTGKAGNAISFLGGTYNFTKALSLTVYGAQFEDVWNQYYVGADYTIPITDGQSLNLNFNSYETRDTGDKNFGSIDDFIYSGAATYSIGAQSFVLAYQKNTGDTPFDYVGGDSVFLNNSVMWSDFNGAHEQSFRVGYNLNFSTLGVPGLTFGTLYVKGNEIDGSHADPTGAYSAYIGNKGEHHELDVTLKYVVQSGPAKNLSIQARQAWHRGDSTQMDGDIDQTRLIFNYPINIF